MFLEECLLFVTKVFGIGYHFLVKKSTNNSKTTELIKIDKLQKVIKVETKLKVSLHL